MTTAEYREMLARLGLRVTTRATAQALGVSVPQLARYAAGKSGIPGPLAKLLAMYTRFGVPDEEGFVMTLKMVRTPSGFVVGEIFASGEHAWRLTDSGNWHYCMDHKGPWVCVAPDEVPAHLRDAVEKYRRTNL